MVQEMPEIFIRNDEGRIHQVSDLQEILISVPPLFHLGLFTPKLNFNVKCDFFAKIVTEGPWKHKEQ